MFARRGSSAWTATALLCIGFVSIPTGSADELRGATFDEVGLADAAARDFVFDSYAHGPARGQLGQWAWRTHPRLVDGTAGCELPELSSTMCGCAAGWHFELVGSVGQVCRNDGSRHWNCAPGWQRHRGPPYCHNPSDDACEIVGSQTHVPCGPLPDDQLNRVVVFQTGFYDLAWDMDTMVPSSFRASGGESLSVSGGLRVAGSECAGPVDEDISPGGYPVRLVRAGRYMSQYWVGGLQCGGATASLEVFAWPDCFELRLLSEDGSDATVSLMLGGFQGSASGAGSASLIVCAQGDGSFASFDPQEREHLEITATASSAAAVAADGAGWTLTLPNGGRNTRTNDEWSVVVANSAAVSVPARLHFYVASPRGITGIAAVVRNASDAYAPSGLHAQLSKNWHRDRDNDVPHEGSWLSVVLMLRVPARSSLSFQLLLAYQFFGELHSVSHSQLSLIGWGSNGHWDEVGIGSAGEAITYEPDGAQRRTMVDDVRPQFVCGMNSAEGACDGNYQTTGWTANVGGMDFLSAFTSDGSYQYLTGVTSHYRANGPRLTNVTYGGVTRDGAVRVARSVSTWAADDFARHLHSFRYDALENVTYGRLVLYQLGADYYNDVSNAGFAYGGASGLLGERASTSDVEASGYAADFRQAACGEPPCWFALISPDEIAHRGLVVRKWRARLGGVDRPAAEGPAFSIVGTPQGGAGLELGLPSDVQGLQVGDFVEADLEILVFPRSSEVYYGPSSRLTAWLDGAASQPWSVVAQEAEAGDLDVTVTRGALERAFPLRVRADGVGQAVFRVQLPAGWPGVLPITISGLGSSLSGTLWRRGLDGSWVEQAPAGDFQVDLEGGAGYAFTFSLQLSAENEGAAGQESEFAFSDGEPQYGCTPPGVPNAAPAGGCSEWMAVDMGSATCTPQCADGH